MVALKHGVPNKVGRNSTLFKFPMFQYLRDLLLRQRLRYSCHSTVESFSNPCQSAGSPKPALTVARIHLAEPVIYPL